MQNIQLIPGGSNMKRLLTATVLVAVGLAVATPIFTAGTAHAIPAFTRAHKTECTTCHTIFPELTEQGQNFYKNSFVWVETKGAGEAKPAKAAKEPKGEGKEYLILSSLPEYVPVSFGGVLNASYNDQASDGNEFDLASRAAVLFAGGSFLDKMGFYLNYTLYSEGIYDPNLSNVPLNNNPNLVELFMQARRIFGSPVNIKAGRLKPDLSLWKGYDKVSTTPLATTSYRVGANPFYVDGPEDAIEANAILGGRVYTALGIDKRKNVDRLDFFGSVSVKLGGADYEGKEAAINLDSDSIFDYLMLTLNSYFYTGTIRGGAANAKDDYYRYGFEADARYQRFRSRIASTFGRDNNANFLTTPDEKRSSVVIAEGSYLVGSNIIPGFRYEYEDNGTYNFKRYIPYVSYAPLQNAKMVLEYKHVDGAGSSNVVNLAAVISF
jgi:hypothetical protein